MRLSQLTRRRQPAAAAESSAGLSAEASGPRREQDAPRGASWALRLFASLPSQAVRMTAQLLRTLVKWCSLFLDFLSLFLFLRAPEPFIVTYERQFGRKHPVFFRGAAQEAFDSARRNDRLLAIYFHASRSSEAASFCTRTLTDDLAIELLDNTCVFYAADASSSASEAARLARAFFPAVSASARVPAFLLLLPQATNANAGASAGPLSPSLAHAPRNRILLDALRAHELDTARIIAALLQGQEKAEEMREAKRRKMREHEENRLLREEQEREFAEVMRLESLKMEEKERRRQREEQKRTRTKQRQQAAEARRAARRENAERFLREEAQAASLCDASRTSICLRLPSGARVSRQFLSETSLDDLYLWADCLGESTKNEDMNIPLRFHLVVPPKRALTRGSQTLLEAGLHPNSAVLLVPSDEEDD
ncbi:UBX domain-containing protein [Besnoitia besnoiti]|uniref:UBX domain-containing protein n=1 Tax=Besnoitia besnoiti TaxID=94643 RepID=A0A2A9M7D4_BESBE|nr:UBX domain-containing protein [Besnoitia besnoiti]PFH32211.1 UBX domain-containing protein [Besnoitia besnoiti]